MFTKIATLALLFTSASAFANASKYNCTTFLYNQKGLHGSTSARLPNSESQFELNLPDPLATDSGFARVAQQVNYNNGVSGEFALMAQNMPMSDGTKAIEVSAAFNLQNGQVASASMIPKDGALVAIKVSGDIWAEAVCDLVP